MKRHHTETVSMGFLPLLTASGTRVLDQQVDTLAGYALYHGDNVEVLDGVPPNSVHLTVTSPPFSDNYVYSDSERDAGNVASDAEFFEGYKFLVQQLHRVTVPGRLCAVHCKQLVRYKGRDGAAGLRDFRGDIIRAHQAAGFEYHSEVTIWTDPVLEMQRTKAHGLLYKQLRADSSFSRQGLAEYLLLFRKWPKDEAEEAAVEPVTHTRTEFPLDVWQRYASPVWFDVNRTRVLNVEMTRESSDEKHLCPLQLGLIERAIRLWSNPGDVVLSPFLGIGSEGYIALKTGRKFVGVELKTSYFAQAVRNLKESASIGANDLFREVDAA